jgi:hypothetical protein
MRGSAQGRGKGIVRGHTERSRRTLRERLAPYTGAGAKRRWRHPVSGLRREEMTPSTPPRHVRSHPYANASTARNSGTRTGGTINLRSARSCHLSFWISLHVRKSELASGCDEVDHAGRAPNTEPECGEPVREERSHVTHGSVAKIAPSNSAIRTVTPSSAASEPSIGIRARMAALAFEPNGCRARM